MRASFSVLDQVGPARCRLQVIYQKDGAVKGFLWLGVMLSVNLAMAGSAQSQPFANASILPPFPAVVTLSGTLDSHGGMMVLLLDQPVALQAADGHSVAVAGQPEIEVIGVAATVKDFHPSHVKVTGTLSHSGDGNQIAVTVQGIQRTG